MDNHKKVHFTLKYFLKHVKENFANFKSNIIDDKYFLDINPKDITEKNLEIIFRKIYDYLKINKVEKSIDWIIKSYLNNNFGCPSSFENIGRYKDCMSKYNKLIKNKLFIKTFNKDFERILNCPDCDRERE